MTHEIPEKAGIGFLETVLIISAFSKESQIAEMNDEGAEKRPPDYAPFIVAAQPVCTSIAIFVPTGKVTFIVAYVGTSTRYSEARGRNITLRLARRDALDARSGAAEFFAEGNGNGEDIRPDGWNPGSPV
jgi:hypothetical protein